MERSTNIAMTSAASEDEHKIQQKEREIKNLMKIRDDTQSILEQLKLRVQAYEKYEHVLSDSLEVTSRLEEISKTTKNIQSQNDFTRLPLAQDSDHT
eukprot:jgi/Galph1/5377/GphlegSOOS_G4098.1